MAIARSKLVDVSVAHTYHCVSRCVRKAFLLGEGEDDRKKWLENQLEELADVFAVGGRWFFVDGQSPARALAARSRSRSNLVGR